MHNNIHKPINPASSNVKSVQGLGREMMAGPTVKKTHNYQQQNNMLNQQNRPHGQIHNRPGYNANQLPRQNHIGMRNNQPYQHFMRGGGNNHQRFLNHQGNYNRTNNPSGSANSFDDKNRDTFGEDFVMDHQIQQQARQQRYHYGERDLNNRRGNGLITPGHVHVLGILRGARESHAKPGVPAEPTGNPHLDMQQQRKQDRKDEYSNLMTFDERQWITNIQLYQVKSVNPWDDDYYYTAHQKNKELNNNIDMTDKITCIRNHEKMKKRCKRSFEKLERNHDNEESVEKEAISSVASKPQVKRTDEGAQLLLPAESKLSDIAPGSNVSSSGDGYTPKQFTNSLGCLQAVTV